MAFYPITMNQVKQIYKLYSEGVGIKRIAVILGISKNTVKSYLRKTQELELPDGELMAIENPVLADQLKPVSALEKENYQAFLQRAEYYADELSNRKRTHVTRMILWQEDFNVGLIQLKYSRFCFHLKRYLKSKHPSMVMVHRPGEKMFVDFAGDKLYYIDRETGETIAAEVLLFTLGYSNYTLAVATPSQKNEDLIEGLVILISRLGAIPSAIVPDNLKSAVTTPDRYEAVINEKFLDMANYYGLVVLPTRPIKPKDKAKVETHVNVIYQQVYARLRHMTFYSLEELNQALHEKVELLNDAVMQDYGVSRKMLLERDERALLKPLPAHPYSLVNQSKHTVGQNGHVKVTSISKYISVPYHLIGQKVTVLISNGIARIYHQRQCVATHAISNGQLYISNPDHLSSVHKEYLNSLSPDSLRDKARAIGPEVEALINAVLNRGLFPEQMYKTCQGILALQLKCERIRFQRCCQLAVANNLTSLRYMRHLVTSAHVKFNEEPGSSGGLPLHDNIRGRDSYI
jgi:transposase